MPRWLRCVGIILGVVMVVVVVVAGAVLWCGDSRLNQTYSIELIEFRGQYMRTLAESLFPKVLTVLQRFDQSTESRRPLPSPVVLRTFVSLMAGHLVIDSVVGQSALFQDFNQNYLDGEIDIFLHGVLAC